MDNSSSIVYSTRDSRCNSVATGRLGLSSAEDLSALRGSSPILEILIEELQASGLRFLPFVRKTQYLGQGGQFVAYEAALGWSGEDNIFAVKQPKFDINPSLPLSLVEPAALKHLFGIYREVVALSHPDLQGHPNIVKLLAWSHDPISLTKIPILVLELADGSLFSILQRHGSNFPLSARYKVCHDVASGLNVLHECGLVHGDLKPENVLIFSREGMPVAKLADFGFSISEVRPDGKSQIMGGTSGWQAPEMVQGRRMSIPELAQADNYSFGLLVWSAMLLSGRLPPSRSDVSRSDLVVAEIEHACNEGRDGEILGHISSIVISLLHEDARQRPDALEILFSLPLLTENLPTFTSTRGLGVSAADSNEGPLSWDAYFDWELPHLPRMFIESLMQEFRQNPGGLKGHILFSMFLAEDTSVKDYQTVSNKDLLNILCASASKGFPPARAAIPIVHRYFGAEPCESIRSNLEEWLEESAAMGSRMALWELKKLDIHRARKAVSLFREFGGYTIGYSWIAESKWNTSRAGILQDNSFPDGYTKLHGLAAYSTLNEIRAYLKESQAQNQINALSEDQETPLYLACSRGAWDIAFELLEHGADPSIRCTSFAVSCMHWIFTFDEQCQYQAVQCLMDRGANVDVLASLAVPFPEFPFLLPPGTPLHWAVATSSHSAIAALLSSGADPLVRDGSDPYLYDDRVRGYSAELYDPNVDLCHPPTWKTQGMSALDISAVYTDPFIFEWLSANNKIVDINQADEEGFTALHRFSRAEVGRTNTGIRFSRYVFRGSKTEKASQLNRTIKSMKSIGADLDLMTVPNDSGTGQTFPERAGGDRNRTALMLAAADGDVELTAALLDAGASVNIENGMKGTALNCIADGQMASLESYLDIVDMLISNGADVDHRNFMGVTPLMRAIASNLTGVVDLLLSRGARMDRHSNEGKIEAPNVFFLFVHAEKAFETRQDTAVLSLLKRFALNDSDPAKLYAFTNLADTSGRTLLHIFAQAGLLRCMRALFQHGAESNPIQRYCYAPFSQPYKEWSETPLDVAIEVKRSRKANMLRDRQYQRDEYEDLIRRDTEVITLLQEHGGIQLAEEEDRNPELFSTATWYV